MCHQKNLFQLKLMIWTTQFVERGIEKHLKAEPFRNSKYQLNQLWKKLYEITK